MGFEIHSSNLDFDSLRKERNMAYMVFDLYEFCVFEVAAYPAADPAVGVADEGPCGAALFLQHEARILQHQTRHR